MNEWIRKKTKVYSIWVCINAEQNQADSIVEYKIVPNTLYFGEHRERRFKPKEHRFDIMRVVMIYLSQEWETSDKLLGLLTTLFGKLDKDIRKQTLEEVYGLPLTKEIEKGVSEMCNLGAGIAEDYLQMGIEQGIERGRLEMLHDLVKENAMSINEAAKRMNMTEEAFRKAVTH